MDIVERLRNEANIYDADDVDLHYDAANEIKRLRQQVAELEKQNAQTIKANEFLNNKLSEAIKELNKLDVATATRGE